MTRIAAKIGRVERVAKGDTRRSILNGFVCVARKLFERSAGEGECANVCPRGGLAGVKRAKKRYFKCKHL